MQVKALVSAALTLGGPSRRSQWPLGCSPAFGCMGRMRIQINPHTRTVVQLWILSRGLDPDSGLTRVYAYPSGDPLRLGTRHRPKKRKDSDAHLKTVRSVFPPRWDWRLEAHGIETAIAIGAWRMAHAPAHARTRQRQPSASSSASPSQRPPARRRARSSSLATITMIGFLRWSGCGRDE
jgi:hypothetical protein